MSKKNTKKSVILEIVDNIAVITMNDPNSPLNTLSREFSEQLGEAFAQVRDNTAIQAAVLISSKKNGFIAGADVRMLQACSSAAEVEALSKSLQEELQKVADSKKPIVAAIHGNCLGGGLEIALACHYRIAASSSHTILALPEVMLGILPGGSGTQRLPRLIGLQAALDMMLSGKKIRAKKAKKMGLVDEIVLEDALLEVAIEAAKKLSSGKLKHRNKEKSTPDMLLEDNIAGRTIVFKQAHSLLMAKTRGRYPAPFAILKVVEHGLNKGMKAGLKEEAKQFGILSQTSESASLISLFFAQTALKKNRYGTVSVDVENIGVLGAGLMGSGIALISVLKDFSVQLKDISQENLAKGKKQIWTELERKRKRKQMTSFERDQKMSKVLTKTNYHGFKHCDIVIEAVFEDLKLKHKVIKEVEEHIHKDCIFASNTSALPLSEIAKASKRPENVVGMHYFSPVHKMPLLEIIAGEKSSDRALALAVDVGIKQGKTVIVVKDGPGFYTTRILAPFFEEAAHIIQEGVDFHDFDNLMKDFGFPVGPVALLDEIGLDVAAHVAHDMDDFFADRYGRADSSAVNAMVKAVFLGRKSGKGFYLYGKKSNKKDATTTVKNLFKKILGSKSSGKDINLAAVEIFRAQKNVKAYTNLNKKMIKELQQRMAARMINEAVYCLQEGILQNPLDGDVGAVFGLGFPPFLGGPFRYIDAMGASKMVAMMEGLAEKHGKRFIPAPMLHKYAKQNKTFY